MSLISKNLINGEWVDATNGATLAVKNPATGEVIGHVPDVSHYRVVEAISAAHAAQPLWAGMTPYARADILLRWGALIDQHNEELAQIMVAECGKPITEARAEVKSTSIAWFAEEAKRNYGRIIPANVEGRQIQLIKQPVGVSGLITPWNFPAAMITRKLGAALAAGCAVVLKPDHRTPFVALAMAKMAQEAGLPKGVLNVVTGDAAMIGETLCTHPSVRKISFTGSTRVGRILLAQCAPQVKKLSLELGGNAPFIVFDSVSVDDAVREAMTAKLRNGGQSCVAANRFYIHDALHEAFVDKLTQEVRKVKQGDGRGEDIRVGTLIDKKAATKVDELVQDAVKNGAHCVLGGKISALGPCFYEPTILTGVTSEMHISREEIFGPVFAIQTFADEAEALRHANDTDMGLASYFMTRDLAQSHRVAAALEYGMVGVNTGFMSFAATPFGGIKQSGQGRESGAEGLDAFLEIKTVTINNT